jgi:uncharacterized protein YndB with AHSA1/START domain
MSDSGKAGGKVPYTAALVVRRIIRARPEALFAAWTDPQQLLRWWGPQGVICTGAEVDLRVGGSYRIANRMPDGSTLWIAGEFEVIEPPSKLTYTWRLEIPEAGIERVSVSFIARDSATEVIVTHERIVNEAARTRHESGWIGCLAGLARLAQAG